MEAVTEARPRARVRREQSATESLTSIALLLEAVLVFFVALAVFGLHVLPVGPALGGGAGLLVVLLIACRATRWAWGLGVGWVLQAVLIATGLLLPVMWFIGAGFLGLWIFCFVKGRQLDARKAAYFASHPSESPSASQSEE